MLLLKSGESAKGGELQAGTGGSTSGKRTLGKAIGKSGLLFKNKNPNQVRKARVGLAPLAAGVGG